jgi:hypothetical protein
MIRQEISTVFCKIFEAEGGEGKIGKICVPDYTKCRGGEAK